MLTELPPLKLNSFPLKGPYYDEIFLPSFLCDQIPLIIF